MTTMLQLMQQAASELGIASPSTVASNTAQDTVQMLALLNASGYELLRKHAWRTLTKQYAFYTSYLTTTGTWTTASAVVSSIPTTTGLDATYICIGTGLPNNNAVVTVDSGTQVTLTVTPTAAGTAATIYFQKVKYALPSDYEALIPRTMWDKSKRGEMLGPEDAHQWEWLQSGYIATGPRVRWRLFGTYFQIWPGFSTSEYLGFEYRSNAWAATAAGVAKSSFTLDTDTCIYPDRLMVLALKLKYFEAKGFDTTAIYRDYREELEAAMALDMSSANLSFAPRPGTVLIGYDNIPDSNYGL